MNCYNAARAAGYSESMSRCSHRLEKSAKVCMSDAFEQVGITDTYLAKHAQEGMNATKIISATIIAKSGDGLKDADSMSKDFIEVPDWQARHRYYETVCKMSDRVKDKVEHSGIPGTNIYVAPNRTYVFTSDPTEAGIRGISNTESQESFRRTQQAV